MPIQGGTVPLLEVGNLNTFHLQKINLQVYPGECVWLRGPSGSGKTLLLRAIVDLDPNEGVLRLNGCSRHSYRPEQWRSEIGMLPAESAWWADTVAAHFPSEQVPIKKELFNLGLDENILMRHPLDCSSGERQRLGLLRLLIRQPKVVLLDEPTANVDYDNRLRMESWVREWVQHEQRAVIWVTHDSEQAMRIGDRGYFLDLGKIRESKI